MRRRGSNGHATDTTPYGPVQPTGCQQCHAAKPDFHKLDVNGRHVSKGCMPAMMRTELGTTNHTRRHEESHTVVAFPRWHTLKSGTLSNIQPQRETSHFGHRRVRKQRRTAALLGLKPSVAHGSHQRYEFAGIESGCPLIHPPRIGCPKSSRCQRRHTHDDLHVQSLLGARAINIAEWTDNINNLRASNNCQETREAPALP